METELNACIFLPSVFPNVSKMRNENIQIAVIQYDPQDIMNHVSQIYVDTNSKKAIEIMDKIAKSRKIAKKPSIQPPERVCLAHFTFYKDPKDALLFLRNKHEVSVNLD